MSRISYDKSCFRFEYFNTLAPMLSLGVAIDCYMATLSKPADFVYLAGALFLLCGVAFFARRSVFTFDATTGKVKGYRWDFTGKKRFEIDLREIRGVFTEEMKPGCFTLALKTNRLECPLFTLPIADASVPEQAAAMAKWLRQQGCYLEKPIYMPARRKR
jgi:hypothetical protein